MRITTTWMFFRWAGLAIFALALVVSDSQPAMAQSCRAGLRECFFRAALESNYWYMWRKGLDCEVDFADCVRHVLLGN